MNQSKTPVEHDLCPIQIGCFLPESWSLPGTSDTGVIGFPPRSLCGNSSGIHHRKRSISTRNPECHLLLRMLSFQLWLKPWPYPLSPSPFTLHLLFQTQVQVWTPVPFFSFSFSCIIENNMDFVKGNSGSTVIMYKSLLSSPSRFLSDSKSSLTLAIGSATWS